MPLRARTSRPGGVLADEGFWVGIVPVEGEALAERQAHHLEVAYAGITLEPWRRPTSGLS
jgi:hypothetical protein